MFNTEWIGQFVRQRMYKNIEAELNERIPIHSVLKATEEFLDSAAWTLEFGERMIAVPKEPKPYLISRAFIKAHSPDVFLGDHFEATVALGPKVVSNNVFATAGTLRLYFNLEGKFVSEDRYGPPE